MSENELLLAISNIIQQQLEPINKKIDQNNQEIHEVKLLIENDVLPRISNIEACYTSTYRRYAAGVEEMTALKADVEILKKVVTEHSEKLQRLA